MNAIDLYNLTKIYRLYKSPKDRLIELVSITGKKRHSDFFALNNVSLAIKKGLTLANNVGIIDADYYNNPSNEGHIMVALANWTNRPVVIAKGERIAQGIFEKYLVADADETLSSERVGGIGSTNIEK